MCYSIIYAIIIKDNNYWGRGTYQGAGYIPGEGMKGVLHGLNDSIQGICTQGTCWVWTGVDDKLQCA